MSCRVRIWFLFSLLTLMCCNAYAVDKGAQPDATQASSSGVASEPGSAAKAASGSIADTTKTAVGGVIDLAKGVADLAKQAYHGAADVGKKVGSDAAEVGKETGRKAKETFAK